MDKNKDFSQDLRECIVELHDKGLGYRKIRAQLCVPIASVETIIRKWKCRNTTLSKPQTGRPRKINNPAARKSVRTVVQRPQTTRKELKDDLKASGIEASKHTIRRALRRDGLRSRTPRQDTYSPETSRQGQAEVCKRPFEQASSNLELSTVTASSSRQVIETEHHNDSICDEENETGVIAKPPSPRLLIFIFSVPASCLPPSEPAPHPAKVEDQKLKYFLQKDKITSFDAFKPERNLQKQYKNLIISRSIISAYVDTEKEKKLVFLTRQLELLSQKQFSVNDYCFAIQSYPKCNYEQLRDFLVLPCKRKLQYLTSSIDKDQVLRERFDKVHTLQQKNVFLLVAEVQIRPTVSFSGGLLCGMAVNNRDCKATSILITK
ncbi:Transposase Tc1-like [Trinorchestia longiramus]|nr:Transposase Tc1-like [Trinorchestia longiramus]